MNLQVKGVHDVSGRRLRQRWEKFFLSKSKTKPNQKKKEESGTKDFKEIGEKLREPDVIG